MNIGILGIMWVVLCINLERNKAQYEAVRKEEKPRRDVEGQVREASCGRRKKIPAKSREDMVNAGYHGLGYLRLVLATG